MSRPARPATRGPVSRGPAPRRLVPGVLLVVLATAALIWLLATIIAEFA